MESRDRSHSPARRRFAFAAIMAVAALVLAAVWFWPRPEPVVQAPPSPPAFTEYVVQDGDYLIGLESKLKVPWRVIWNDNRETIIAAAKEICFTPNAQGKTLADRLTGREGVYYCNNEVKMGDEPMVYANSLKGGLKLRIRTPSGLTDLALAQGSPAP